MTGAGPPVVLLHGQPGSRSDWAAVVTELVPGHLVIVPDRLGYGTTGGRPGGFSANARAVARLLRSLDVPPAVVVGHSWGGGVALQMAVDHSSLVKALVLVSSVSPDDAPGPLDRLLARPAAGALLAALALSTAGTMLSWGPARAYAGRRLSVGAPSQPDDVARAVRAWRRPTTWATFAVEQRALVHELPGLSARARSICVPAVVLVGSADRVVPPSSGRRLAGALPQATLHNVEGAGHLLPQRHPSAVAEAVREVATR